MPINISRRAGIDRQLHPLKAKDLMKDKLIKIDRKKYIRLKAYQSKAPEHVNSFISFKNQSACHVWAGIGGQLHPLKA